MDPREIHLHALKRVLRYLQETRKLRLKIGSESGKLIISSDASWCTTSDSKSFSGYTVKIGNSIIGWKSRKQKIVTLSTMESELVGVCDAISEGKWMIGLLEELNQSDLITKPVQINTDSQAVIDWITNPRVNNRNKHIHRKYHYIRDEKDMNEIELHHIKSSELESDAMTKDLSADIMLKHSKILGLVSG